MRQSSRSAVERRRRPVGAPSRAAVHRCLGDSRIRRAVRGEHRRARRPIAIPRVCRGLVRRDTRAAARVRCRRRRADRGAPRSRSELRRHRRRRRSRAAQDGDFRVGQPTRPTGGACRRGEPRRASASTSSAGRRSPDRGQSAVQPDGTDATYRLRPRPRPRPPTGRDRPGAGIPTARTPSTTARSYARPRLRASTSIAAAVPAIRCQSTASRATTTTRTGAGISDPVSPSGRPRPSHRSYACANASLTPAPSPRRDARRAPTSQWETWVRECAGASPRGRPGAATTAPGGAHQRSRPGFAGRPHVDRREGGHQGEVVTAGEAGHLRRVSRAGGPPAERRSGRLHSCRRPGPTRATVDESRQVRSACSIGWPVTRSVAREIAATSSVNEVRRRPGSGPRSQCRAHPGEQGPALPAIGQGRSPEPHQDDRRGPRRRLRRRMTR